MPEFSHPTTSKIRPTPKGSRSVKSPLPRRCMFPPMARVKFAPCAKLTRAAQRRLTEKSLSGQRRVRNKYQGRQYLKLYSFASPPPLKTQKKPRKNETQWTVVARPPERSLWRGKHAQQKKIKSQMAHFSLL